MLFFYSEISVVVKIVFPFYTGDKGGFVSGIQYLVCRNKFHIFLTKASISVTISCVYILYTLLLCLYPSWKCCYSDVIFKVCFTFIVSNNIIVRIEAFLSYM